MSIRQIASPRELAAYDAWVRHHPQGSLWQSLAWKKFQESLGREVLIYIVEAQNHFLSSALVVIDRTCFGLSTWEIPRGPLGGDEKLLDTIILDARKAGALAVYFSPLSPLPPTLSPLPPTPHPPQRSGRHVWPEATRIIDLTESEEGILAQMKPKGRYNIAVAKKHGIRVEVFMNEQQTLASFYDLLRETARRDSFTPLPCTHYEAFLRALEGSFLLLAHRPPEHTKNPQKPIAGLLGVIYQQTGIYMYGASSSTHRNLMAPYLLQWEAMRLCKARGCTAYDLFGVAPEGAGAHPWSGVSRFKAQFGGVVVISPPEQQRVLRPLPHRLFQLKRHLLG